MLKIRFAVEQIDFKIEFLNFISTLNYELFGLSLPHSYKA